MKYRQLLKEWSAPILIGGLVFILLVSGPYWLPFTIAHIEGISMNPTLANGNMVIVQTAFFDREHIANGTIIVYKWNETYYICHRIIEVRLFCYICKGDNNPDIDPPVEPEQIYAIFIGKLW